MSEAEQAAAMWKIAMALPEAAEMIANDARENLGGVDVVSVGSVFAREIEGVQCYLVVAIVPDRDGTDFVPSQVILDVTQNYMAASVNRMTLISCLEGQDITEDLGADRGILITERGHQSAAHEVATLTNITLTTLAKLRQAAKGEILTLALPNVKRRAIAIKHDVDSLHDEKYLIDGVYRPRWVKHTEKPGLTIWVTDTANAGADSHTLSTDE